MYPRLPFRRAGPDNATGIPSDIDRHGCSLWQRPSFSTPSPRRWSAGRCRHIDPPARHPGAVDGRHPPASLPGGRPSLRPGWSPIQELRLRKACRPAWVERSIRSVSDCFDNAMAEGFFATLESSSSTGACSRTATRPHGDLRLHRRIYNTWRQHSSIGNTCSAECERRWLAQPQAMLY